MSSLTPAQAHAAANFFDFLAEKKRQDLIASAKACLYCALDASKQTYAEGPKTPFHRAIQREADRQALSIYCDRIHRLRSCNSLEAS
jgi:hypothetical protein